jgi:hypothetical protein
LLPGGDAPERVIFEELKKKKWGNLWTRMSRDMSWVTDACTNAMTLTDHHEWTKTSANSLFCGGETLWQNMCAEWAPSLKKESVENIVKPIEEALAS